MIKPYWQQRISPAGATRFTMFLATWFRIPSQLLVELAGDASCSASIESASERQGGDPRVTPRTQSSLAQTGDGENWILFASPELLQQLRATRDLRPRKPGRHSPSPRSPASSRCASGSPSASSRYRPSTRPFAKAFRRARRRGSEASSGRAERDGRNRGAADRTLPSPRKAPLYHERAGPLSDPRPRNRRACCSAAARASSPMSRATSSRMTR
jgi:hypothetical protein